MNKNHILLSISMLISGRDEMEKCLNSLLYFKNAFPTEIILVDTGCNAEQRALAEKYADKIIDFIWCNDFAAARNAGLKEACGEWFMYLDDDEWFENPQEIIRFFITAEYKKYNSASYVVRNYMNMEGTLYTDSYPSRMVKLNSKIHFTGRVHEYLTPFEEPRKEFNDYVHHYGYVYQTEQEHIKHAWRNIKLLLEVKKENPGQPRWIFQLAQEYFSVHNYEKVVETCIAGLEEWKKYRNQLTYMPVHIGTLYGYILLSLEWMGRYTEEEEWLKKAFAEPLNKLDAMEVCLVFYDMIGARTYGYLNEDERCLSYFQKYIGSQKKVKNDRSAMETKTAGIITEVFNELLLAETFMVCIPALVRCEKIDIIKQTIENIEWNKRSFFLDEDKLKKILDACCRMQYCSFYVDLIQKLVGEDENIQQLYTVVNRLQKEFAEQGDAEKLQNLHHIIGSLSNQHFCITIAKILWKSEENEETLDKYYEELISKYPDAIFEIDNNVWKIAVEKKIKVASAMNYVDYRVWRRALKRMECWASAKTWNTWKQRLSEWMEADDIRYKLFDMRYTEFSLAEEIKNFMETAGLEEELWAYAESVISFYKPYYKEEVLEENSVGLPDELQLALELKKQQEYYESGDDRKALENMKNCLGIYPKLEKVILTYAEMVRNRMQQQITEAKEAQKELQQMIISLKNIAKQKLESGETVAAKAILSQVQQYAPDDDEIKTLLHNLEEEVQ